ncbi:hypothetical protein Btru_063050 [Bulinus truncatus]|nr:hypothetical protein Btru_063050 [Bulinus truncatus]
MADLLSNILLGDNMSSLDDNMSSLDDNMSSLDYNMSSLDYNMSSLDYNMSSLDDNMSSLDDNMSSLDDNMSSLDYNMSSLDYNMSSLDDNMSSLDYNMSSLDDNMSSLDDNMSSLDDNMSSLDHNIWSIGTSAWIGANDIDQEGHFVWASDRSVINVSLWRNELPNNANNDEDCVELYRTVTSPLNDKSCSVPLFFFCQTELCQSIFPDSVYDFGHCFRYFDEQLSWDNAQKYCLSLNSHLVESETPQIQKLLTEYLDSKTAALAPNPRTYVAIIPNWSPTRSRKTVLVVTTNYTHVIYLRFKNESRVVFLGDKPVDISHVDTVTTSLRLPVPESNYKRDGKPGWDIFILNSTCQSSSRHYCSKLMSTRHVTLTPISRLMSGSVTVSQFPHENYLRYFQDKHRHVTDTGCIEHPCVVTTEVTFDSLTGVTSDVTWRVTQYNTSKHVVPTPQTRVTCEIPQSGTPEPVVFQKNVDQCSIQDSLHTSWV